jgi:L-alanine-DL-glutamate epimerase-like enolase superfamily enzyme
MREYCLRAANELAKQNSGQRHPIGHGMNMHRRISESTGDGSIPFLAGLVCVSPFDAALHDGAGRALGLSAFRFYDASGAGDDSESDMLFPGKGALAAVHDFLLPQPSRAVDGWYVVSGTDPLAGDFRAFVQQRGFRCFKLKTHGKDSEADARRTAEVFQAARALGVKRPRLSADSNEGNPDAASVMDYLDCLQRLDAEAYDALEYLEQPTGRDIVKYAFDWHAVNARKPVLVDEGLTGPDVLPHVAEQGWGGICLKTCKGHSFNLIAGAWAHARGMKVAVQDLTNPGLAAIHSCLLAQHVPTVNGVELNSPQFTPAANEPWIDREAVLFSPVDGTHSVSDPWVAGLGSAL